MIYYGKQFIDKDDLMMVEDVLLSDFLTQGPMIEQFERRVAEYCGARYAVAVTNATSALHIGCKALGLTAGDQLWTSPITFVASANCARYCGADVDFVDIDSKTYNMSVDVLEQKLKTAERLPKIVVPVHLAGQSCDMERIKELSKRYGFAVMEDASHAIGADYKGGKVGNCRYSDLTVFSFHPVKIITTGEGGMLLTNDEELYNKLKLYRSHGVTRDPSLMTHESDGPWYYQQVELGFNYRMTDIQAALGYSQMAKLDAFVERRRELAARYDKLLKDLPLVTPYQSPDTNSSWHLYVVRLDRDAVKKSKVQIFNEMREKGVALNVHYIPVHTQPYYEQLGHRPEECPEALKYYDEAFTLPLYFSLRDAQQDYVVDCLREVLHGG